MATLDINRPPSKPDPVAGVFVPADRTTIHGMKLERLSVLLTMAQTHGPLPTILVGHTGTAKSTLIQTMHAELGWPYRSFNAHDGISVDTLLGKWIIRRDEGMVYQLGILPFCMKHGIALTIEEINYVAPEAYVLLHEYVDKGQITLSELDPTHEDFVIKAHPNFRLYGTMNPPEYYPGARDLSPALARRSLIRAVDPIPDTDEIRVVQSMVDGMPGAERLNVQQMVRVANEMRQLFNEGQTRFYFSTADLIMWARVSLQIGGNMIDAAHLAVTGKANDRADVDHLIGRIRIGFEDEKDF